MIGKASSPKHLSPGQANQYLRFLSEAIKEINNSLDYETTLANLAWSMVPELSDWCAVDILQKNGKLKRLAIAHSNPEKIKTALELSRKYPRDPKAKSGTPHVLKTGEPEMRNNIPDEMLAAAAINEEHLQMMRDIGFYSLMIVPIKCRGKTLGTITLVWSESHHAYSLADLAFAEALANVAGSAIDKAQVLKA